MRIQKLVEERSVAIDEDIDEELRDIILEKNITNQRHLP